LLKENEAEILSLVKVQNAQADAYSGMKNKLGMTNKDLLNFIKTKLIKNYNGKDMALNIQTPENSSKE